MRAAQDQIKSMAKSAPDRASLNTLLQKAATDATAAALAALMTAKGAAADADAFRTLLAGIGQKVANASTEGGPRLRRRAGE